MNDEYYIMYYLIPLKVPGLQEKLSLPCIVTLVSHSEESSLRLHEPPSQILPKNRLPPGGRT